MGKKNRMKHIQKAVAVVMNIFNLIMFECIFYFIHSNNDQFTENVVTKRKRSPIIRCGLIANSMELLKKKKEEEKKCIQPHCTQ